MFIEYVEVPRKKENHESHEVDQLYVTIDCHC